MISAKIFSFAFGLIFMILNSQILPVDAVCCGPCTDPNGREQCSCGSSDFCCGNGACNAFCCKCDNGCKSNWDLFDTKRQSRLDMHKTKDAQMDCLNIIQSVDTNDDGFVTFTEWASHTAPLSPELERLVARWASFDVEGKGFLTKDEAYHRKA